MPTPVRWLQNLTHPEVQRLQSALRERLDPLLEKVLEKGLYVGQHLAARVLEVDVVGGAAFALTLDATFPSEPRGVVVWRAREKTSGAAPPGAVFVPWSATRVGGLWHLSAPQAYGLTGGTTYTLTLAVHAG